jgi:hypothetical protein
MTNTTRMAAPATIDPLGDLDLELQLLESDPDVVALFAEVDAILCAALAPRRCPPAPPATGSAHPGRPRSAGRSRGALLRPRRAPVHHVRALPRSPPPPAHLTRDPDRRSRERGR